MAADSNSIVYNVPPVISHGDSEDGEIDEESEKRLIHGNEFGNLMDLENAISKQNRRSSFSGGLRFKKGPWTAIEDAVLIEHVSVHGEGNWNSVHKLSGLARCGKSCRLRWTNHLRPNLKKGTFTPEEETTIVEAHASYGNKWARIAAMLPGRTDNDIKNYWNTRVKRHQRLGIQIYPSHLRPLRPEPSPKRGLQRRCQSYTTFDFRTSSDASSLSFAFHGSRSANALSSFSGSLDRSSRWPGNYRMDANGFPSSSSSSAPEACYFSFQTPSTPTKNPAAEIDFSIPARSPPKMVQSPFRFRRFHTSASNLASGAKLNDDTPSALPLAIFSPSASPLPSSSPTTNEIKKENERLSCLLAEITRNQQVNLISTQLQLITTPVYHHNNDDEVGSDTWKNIQEMEHGNHGHGHDHNEVSFCLEDLLS